MLMHILKLLVEAVVLGYNFFVLAQIIACNVSARCESASDAHAKHTSPFSRHRSVADAVSPVRRRRLQQQVSQDDDCRVKQALESAVTHG